MEGCGRTVLVGVCDHHRCSRRQVVGSVRHAPSYRPLLPLHSLTARLAVDSGLPAPTAVEPPLPPSPTPGLASNATRVEQSDGWIAVKGFVELGRWGEVDGLVAELVVARESGVDVGAGPFDDTSAELPLPAIGANGAHASFAARPSHRERSGVKFRRGQPLGRARTSGGFARRANFNDHETARSCCEPSRRLDAVELR